MSARLLAQLAERGIQIRRVGDRLGVTPANLSPEAEAFIREHRDALLAALPPAAPSFPSWPREAVTQAVESRAAALRDTGLTGTEAELQAATEALNPDRFEVHPTGRCPLHGCAFRLRPRQSVYGCPACTPGAFAGQNRPPRAA